MDNLEDLDSEQDMAAPSSMSSAALVAIGELLRAVGKFGPAYQFYGALTRLAVLLMFANQLLTRLGDLLLRSAVADLSGAQLYLRHPPQAWAAP